MTLHTRGRAVVDYAVGYLNGMEAGWMGSIGSSTRCSPSAA